MNAPLRRQGSCEKFYIEVAGMPDSQEQSETFQRLMPTLFRKFGGEIPFIQIDCFDSKRRRMLDVSWKFINDLDEAARYAPNAKRCFAFSLDFVIWSRTERQIKGRKLSTRAVIVRSHGLYRDKELQDTMRQSGKIL